MPSKFKLMKTLGCWENLKKDEKEEEDRIKSLPTYHTVATIKVVEDVQTVSTHRTPSPTGPINGDATTSTLEEENSMNIEDFKRVSLNDITTSLIDSNDLDFDNCTLPEVIGFLHKISRHPHTSTLNLAFTEHITNALIKVRDENSDWKPPYLEC